ncbi:54S ribosomal protein IMG2 mitochondrial [Spathaspora sp. JA1]|nr:54S ribosomal protein IMG2 mitochondrial [Spathaspora sp. JA1]
MRASLFLRASYFPFPKAPAPKYIIPSLDSISYTSLINNGFGEGNYYISKTKFNHWPVYKKITNQTKIITEVRKVEGDVQLLRSDLLRLNPDLKISVNKTAGYLNIKGDVVDEIKYYFNQGLN